MLGLLMLAGMLTKVLVGILLVLHFVLCLFLIAVVLLQSGKAGDLSSAFGGGPSQANVAAMSSENILTRATKISAFGFMATSLLLALFAHGESGGDSVLDAVQDEAPLEAPAEPGTDADAAGDDAAGDDAASDDAAAATETEAAGETPAETPAAEPAADDASDAGSESE